MTSRLAQSPAGAASVLHPPELLERFRADDRVRARAEERAEPWRDLSLDDLWSLVFGPRITRSWMVWSDGDCPACRRPVNMYGWEMEPFAEPWKLRCPRCGERFPKNDFAAFHESGLDEAGLFDPSRADRGLLFNAEHPDPGDRLRTFGVDDGEGVPGDGGLLALHRHLAGLRAVEAAHRRRRGAARRRVRGHRRWWLRPQGRSAPRPRGRRLPGLRLRRAGRSLRAQGRPRLRVDLARRLRGGAAAGAGLRPGAPGAARRRGTPGLRGGQGPALAGPISRRTRAPRSAPTSSPASCATPFRTRPKIQSNFPTTDVAGLLIRAVLEGREGLEEVYGLLDEVIEKATRVDGLTGEKGLAGYSAISPRTLARCLALFARVDEGFLPRLLERHQVPEPALAVPRRRLGGAAVLPQPRRQRRHRKRPHLLLRRRLRPGARAIRWRPPPSPSSSSCTRPPATPPSARSCTTPTAAPWRASPTTRGTPTRPASGAP